MTSQPAPDWAAIRRRYEETDAAVADICADAGIERSALTAAARKGFWRRQKPRPFPPLRIPTGSAVLSPAAPVRPRPAAPLRAGDSASSKSTGARTKSARGAAKLGARTVSAEKSASSRIASTKTSRAKSAPSAPPTVTPTSPQEAAPIIALSGDIPSRVPPTAPALLTPADRRHLLDRLVAAISRKLEQLERRMAQDLHILEHGDAASATDHERETRAIGALIDNLGKITDLENGAHRIVGKSSATSDIAGDADRWRRELAERLAKIVGAAPGAA